MPKNIFTSWTFYFGLLQIALGVVGSISGLADNGESWTLVITGLASIGFRLKTNGPVTILPQ